MTAEREIQCKVSGYGRGIVPPGCTIVTQGISIGKTALHRVVRAWRPDGTGYTIDYGVQEILSVGRTMYAAIMEALVLLADHLRETPYRTQGGAKVPLDHTLIEAWVEREAVPDFCQVFSRRPTSWAPALGVNSPHSEADLARMVHHKHLSIIRFIGMPWFKSVEAALWTRREDDPPTMLLFGARGTPECLSPDEKGHFFYARHITSEELVETEVFRTPAKTWKQIRYTNDYLIASCLATAAAEEVTPRVKTTCPPRPLRDCHPPRPLRDCQWL